MKKVYVAMSGGVDSSVAAALLKNNGYDVTGLFMKFWSPASSITSAGRPNGSQSSFCLWKKEREDALQVAAILDIPLLTWDFTKEYEEKVVNYMIDAYKKGITPNPDVMCNKEIKFGMFFKKAMHEGADLVATGHYARIGERRKAKGESPEYELLKAKDLNKDQSYFLYNLKQEQLEKTLFPIGEYTKPEVRRLAGKYGLPTAEKKDSQGVCFVGPLKVRQFLKKRIKPKKGKIVLSAQCPVPSRLSTDNCNLSTNHEVILGEHDGIYYYTIGQRHGMDIKTGSGPYFVVRKDIEKNILYVGEEKDLYSDEAVVSDVTWVGEIPTLPAELGVKIRYRSEDAPAVLSNNGTIEQSNNDGFSNVDTNQFKHSIKLKFKNKIRAITPGQSAVFYDGDQVLGGGIIV